MPDSDGLSRDAELLFDAVREAGALALTMQRQELRRWSKPDGSPVSEADEQVDHLLRGKLQTARPGYGWLSEETPDDRTRLANEKIWIVDPIDGTRAFIRGGAQWCVAAALISHGRPVAAAVYRPVTEEFFSAISGGGAQMNGADLTVNDGGTPRAAHIVGTAKSLAPFADHGIKADVSGELPLQLRLAFVAAGHFAAALSIGHKNDWDLAAGDLIVHEAGGRAGDLAGQPFIYNRSQTWQHGLVAAGVKRHAIMIEALRTP